MRAFNDKEFLQLLNTNSFGRKLIHLPTVTSTSDHAFGLLEKADDKKLKELEGTLVLADEQTGGKGRLNRSWLSPKGGLWFSLIFRTKLPQDRIPVLTLIAAFSAASILIADYGVEMRIKWPNDLYHKDFKVGGILSEETDISGQRFIVLGMGLNIDVDKNDLATLENKAANIQEFTKDTVNPQKLLAGIMDRFEEIYLYFSNTGDLRSIFKKMEKILTY